MKCLNIWQQKEASLPRHRKLGDSQDIKVIRVTSTVSKYLVSEKEAIFLLLLVKRS